MIALLAVHPLMERQRTNVHKRYFLTLLLKEHDFLALFSYTGYILIKSKRLEAFHGLWNKYEENETMIGLASIVLPPLAPQSFTLISVLLGTIGTLFLAYDLLGRENGPLRWFTLVITCGLVSAVLLGTIFTIIFKILKNAINLNFILQFLVLGELMGFFTVILVELPLSKTRPPIFSRTGIFIGLALGLLFVLVVKILGGPLEAALAIGVPCAIIVSVWQRITWEPS